MKLRYLVILLSVIHFSLPCFAKKPKELTMIGLEIDGFIQHDQKGILDNMLKDLSMRSGIAHSYKVISFGRGDREFRTKKVDCLLPSSLSPIYYQNAKVIHSEPFSEINYFAFTLAGEKKISTKFDLENKVIGVLRDNVVWQYEKRFNLQNVTYIQVSNIKSMIEMLKKKRIHVAVHDHLDFLNYVKQLSLKVTFDKSFPLANDQLVITCHQSKLARAYIKQINPHLMKIKSEGLQQYANR